MINEAAVNDAAVEGARAQFVPARVTKSVSVLAVHVLVAVQDTKAEDNEIVGVVDVLVTPAGAIQVMWLPAMRLLEPLVVALEEVKPIVHVSGANAPRFPVPGVAVTELDPTDVAEATPSPTAITPPRRVTLERTATPQRRIDNNLFIGPPWAFCPEKFRV